LNFLQTTLLTFCVIPAAAFASPFNGVYDQHPQTCGQPVSDQRIVITDDYIEFWEGRCRLSNPTAIRDMPDALLYDGACSVEDYTYQTRILIKRIDPTDVYRNSSIMMIQNGLINFYALCPPGTQMYGN